MKKIITLLLVILLTMPSFAQKVVSATSESKYVNITKDPPKPPYLEIVSGSLQFADTDGNQKIDAGETAYIRFDLLNSGIGPGLNLKAETRQVNDFKGLSFNKSIPLGVLEPGKTKKVEIPVTGNMDLTDGKVEFDIYIHEANGFHSDPKKITIQTAAFRSPLIRIADHNISSQSGITLERRKPFDLQVYVQNQGQGVAEQVVVRLTHPSNIYCLSENTYVAIGTMGPGEKELINYSFVTTANYTDNSIPFNIILSEKFGRYAESKTIVLNMNQRISEEQWEVPGKDVPMIEIIPASLTSSVDKNIPINNTKYPNRLALIIGNENYAASGSLNAQINVDYARNDAGVFREYALNTLGVEQDNLFFLLDASAGTMNREINTVTQMLKIMGSNSELIFYYAGHGFPDEATRIPYLIPVDIDAANLNYAVKLSDVYRKLSETGAKRITIFLDACFSGGGRNQGLLAARQVRIKPEDTPVAGNMVVFAASSGVQSSLPYHKEKHGVFTFFLLKKLQETSGNITYGELSDYLRREVGIISLRENRKAQDPEVMVSPVVENTWMNWLMK